MFNQLSEASHAIDVAAPPVSSGSNELPYYPIGIVGGGPAGTGPLIAALQNGQLPNLLSKGVAIFESGDRLIRGSLGDYQVNSDTLADTFLEVFGRDPDSLLTDLSTDSATRRLRSFSGASVPLPIAGDFLEAMGRHLAKIIERFPHSKVNFETVIHTVRRLGDGSFEVVGAKAGSPFRARCGQLILATGGFQKRDVTLNTEVMGQRRLLKHHPKVTLTSELLSERNPTISRMAQTCANPKVLIIGSSHSAFSVAWKLLQSKLGARFKPGAIKILYRSRPKVYFNSESDALSAGYRDFDENDICPKTQRLYRLAGMRFDGRTLLMKLLGIENGDEPRVELHSLKSVENNLDELLEQADLIVPAFGYRPRAVTMLDETGEPILLRGCESEKALVDNSCRVIELAGGQQRPLENVFGIGLASGFIPSGDLGGEPSFRGQTNGFWLYQNDVGNLILRQLQNKMAQQVAADHA